MMSGLPPPGGGNKTVQMVDTNSIVKTEANLPLQTPTSQVIQVNHIILCMSLPYFCATKYLAKWSYSSDGFKHTIYFHESTATNHGE